MRVTACAAAACAAFFVAAEPAGPALPAPARRLLDEARKGVRELDPTQAAARIKADPDVFVLDVRTRAEHASGHLPGAVLIPRGLLEFKVHANDLFPDINHGAAPRRDQPILVYCLSGDRSVLACRALRQLGYEKAWSLAGGIESWRQAKLPIEAEAGAAALGLAACGSGESLPLATTVPVRPDRDTLARVFMEGLRSGDLALMRHLVGLPMRLGPETVRTEADAASRIARLIERTRGRTFGLVPGSAREIATTQLPQADRAFLADHPEVEAWVYRVNRGGKAILLLVGESPFGGVQVRGFREFTSSR
jgi:rhodanese-related sulfurtransferase